MGQIWSLLYLQRANSHSPIWIQRDILTEGTFVRRVSLKLLFFVSDDFSLISREAAVHSPREVTLRPSSDSSAFLDVRASGSAELEKRTVSHTHLFECWSKEHLQDEEFYKKFQLAYGTDNRTRPC